MMRCLGFDEVLPTCSPCRCVIATETVIKIGDVLKAISLNERFRASQARLVSVTHLAVIALHVIVFVHGHDSNGFV